VNCSAVKLSAGLALDLSLDMLLLARDAGWSARG
jgi:hypothetical protein